MAYEGAMLGGFFLPEQEFKKVFVLFYKEKRLSLLSRLNLVIKAIEESDGQKAYENWEKLQTELFKNPKIELLVALNFKGASQDTPIDWVFSEYENKLVGKAINDDELTSILGKLKKLTNRQKETRNSYELDRHVKEFLEGINTINVEYNGTEDDEFQYILNRGAEKGALKAWKNTRKRLLEQVNSEQADYTYASVVYGGKNKASENGKPNDAFINHLGKMHALAERDLDKLFSEPFYLSVIEEEKNLNRFGFIDLLVDSTNTTRWYTGGDVITVDKYGKIKTNIQLKTSTGTGDNDIGKIKFKELYNKITQIRDFVKDDRPDRVAELFYKMMKTSTVSTELSASIKKKAIEEVKKALKLEK